MSGGHYTGRLAPSPTGALHLGNARTFMVAYLRARSQGGRLIMRMEDLYHPKDKPGADQAAIDDLRWLGFEWEEEYVQSERREIYAEVTRDLFRRGLIYTCVCTRRDVEAAQSAPHEGEQLFYPGICRGRFSSWEAAVAAKGATPCWRFRVPENTVVEFEDAFAGYYRQDVSQILGDYPLARDKDGAGYTLAATVDDLLMGVTEIVRGDDLLPATPAQILLARSVLSHLQPSTHNSQPLSYLHLPLVVGLDGRRLAKRHGDTRIAAFREAGISARKLIGTLAASCGWAEMGEEISLAELLPRFDLKTIPHEPMRWNAQL